MAKYSNNSNIFFKVTQFLFLTIFNLQTIACPFSNQNEALISQNTQQEMIEFKFPQPNLISNDYALGFWSFYIPQLDLNIQTSESTQYDYTKNEDGQLLLRIIENFHTTMIGFLVINKEMQTINHKFIIFEENQDQELKFEYSISNYEGFWIFTLLSFKPELKIVQVESSTNQKQSVPYFIKENKFSIYIGGKENIQNLNLNSFRGRLSKLISFTDIIGTEDLFLYSQKLCIIPKLNNGEQTIEIVKGLNIFDSDQILQTQFQQEGNTLSLSGWIKFSFQQLQNIITYPLLRVSTKKNYQNQISEGDELLQIYVTVYEKNPEKTQYFILKDYHTFPVQQFFSENQFSKLEVIQNSAETGSYYYYGLQEWHYIKYEFWDSQTETQSALQLCFFNELGLVEYKSQHKQFQNSIFFVFIGGDYFINNYFTGYICDLKFKQNYEYLSDKHLLECHYSCLSCNGPLETHCLSCQTDLFRQYQEEQQKCQCLSTYIDIGIAKCQELRSMFSSIKIKTIEKKTIKNICQYNYFQLPQKDGTIICLQCPQINQRDQLCLDCILDQYTWYIQPICKSDLITRDIKSQFTYRKKSRGENEFDVYFINDDYSLTLYPQYSSFCTSITEDNCVQAKNTHLGKLPIVKCKDNYLKRNQSCVNINPFCIQVNSEGNCILTVDGIYYQNDQFYQCPLQCSKCFFDQYSLTLICSECIDGYSIINNQCQQCGENCLSCISSYDKIKQNSYLLCLKCIDNSKYFLSFDAKNCIENFILNCEHSFQSFKNDSTINTYEYQFQPIDNYKQIDQIITLCAKCIEGYLYLLEENMCVPGLQSKCHMGYSQNLQQIDNQTCLYQDIWIKNESLIFKDYCTYTSLFCAICIQSRYIPQPFYDLYVCLECENGYYSEQITERCFECPPLLNCHSCQQQQKKYEDIWKNEIRAFYKKFIELDAEHQYIVYGQSQNISDYEIICLNCKLGYELYQGLCIKECPQSCLQCEKISNENVCMKCFKERFGRKQSLFNNECIDCPQNCALCQIRSNQELNTINPLFSSQKYQYFSNKCLKQYDDKLFSYDQELNIFIDCEEYKYCQKILTIPINLSCFQKVFDNSQENIHIDDLISGQSFIEFENDYFYLYANQEQISKIIILITSSEVQTCTISDNGLITQQFSKNIFTAKNVEIQFNFIEKVTFQISDILHISNFSKISITGLIIKPILNNIIKQVIFTSVIPQVINLDQVSIIYDNSKSFDKFQIEFQNLTQLLINDLQIQNLYQKDFDYFFLIAETQQSKVIQIQNLQIIESNLQNQEFFLFHVNNNDTIEFKNIQIFANYSNSSFININKNNYFTGYLQFYNFYFKININNTNFINLEKGKIIDIYNFQIFNSQIVNSSIILLNNNFSIQDLSIYNCIFDKNSYGIINSRNLLQKSIQINLQNTSFLKIRYHQTAKFISLNKYNSQVSKVFIKNILISNNQIYNVSNGFNSKDIAASLFYFQVDELEINNITIYRGYGLVDISLYGISNVKFFNIFITQGENYKFFGLHQYLDCQLQQVQGQNFESSLSFLEIQNLLIKNMNIQYAQTYNSPIISIVSQQNNNELDQIIIIVENLLVENNLILLTTPEISSSILMIEGQQQSIIQFSNITFRNNIQHHYISDNLHPSGLLLLIDSLLSNVSIKNSTFQKNLVVNSTDSIFFISCQQLILDNCLFDQNNLFNYDILQPYILSGYSNNQAYEEDLKEIFPIKSYSGNGLFIIEKLNISNCQIFKSQGAKGAGFQIQPQQQSLIVFENIVFINLKNLFLSEIETGGCLHIDGSTSETLEIFIKNINVENVFSRYQGGFLYLFAGDGQVNAEVNNLTINNGYSQLGSIFYVSFSEHVMQSQTFTANNIYFKSSSDGLINYFDQYFKTTYEETEKLRLFNNKTLFYFENKGLVRLDYIRIADVIYQSVINAINIGKMTINDLQAYNNYFWNYFIYISPNKFVINEILINKLVIKSSLISRPFFTLTCEYTEKKSSVDNFKCLSMSQSVKNPFILLSRQLNQNQTFGKCFVAQSQEKMDLTTSGLLLFQSLNSKNKITIENSLVFEITCTSCKYGLFYFNYIESTYNQNINNLWLQNNQCGELGCLNMDGNFENASRILQIKQNKNDYVLKINNYTCLSNYGNKGVCAFINNISTILSNCKFSGNSAISKGGAIFVQGVKKFVIVQSVISKNKADVGGGIFLANQSQLLYNNLITIFQNNTGAQFGNNIASIPNKLTLQFGENMNSFEAQLITSNSSYKLEQAKINTYSLSSGTLYNELFLPSGQQVSSYQIFDWKNKKYISYGKNFRLLTLNHDGEVMKNLSNSFCDIQSRKFNLTSKNNENKFTQNFTNLQQVVFNNTSQDYNLDSLIINFDNELPQEIVLQLQFNCSSIYSPIYSQIYPYLIENHHNNYHLRVNIRALPCQLGEIKNYTDYSCKPCEGIQGFYSLKNNSAFCDLQDDVSTVGVKSAQLNLKPGYWRPYLDSNQISYCSNLMENCIGGWVEGDESCYQGHIGALCEQCDLYNVRGFGMHSVSKKYQCGSCNDQKLNATILTLMSLWTIISILISVQSNSRAVAYYLKTISIHKAFLGRVINLKIKQKSILIKMLTNYFQIISAISSFEINIQKGFSYFINVLGSPISTIVYSLDCLLVKIFQIEIIYARIIWQLIMPILYLLTFIIIYFIGAKLKIIKFERRFLATTLIYMYIYMQQNFIGGLIELLSYREISGFKWILANVSYRYDTSSHYKWLLQLCLPLLFVFAICIPSYFFKQLLKNNQKLDNKVVRYYWGYLYNEYKKLAYFWEIVKILKKQMIIIFLNYYQQYIIIKASIIILILSIYLEINKKFQPFLTNKLNKLDYYSTFTCIVSYTLAICIYISEQQNITQFPLLFTILICFVNFSFLSIIASKIITEYIDDKSKYFSVQIQKIIDFLNKKVPQLQNIHFFKELLQHRIKNKQLIKRRFQKLKSYLLCQAKKAIAIKYYNTILNTEQMNFISYQNPGCLMSNQEKYVQEQKQLAIMSQMMFKSEPNSTLKLGKKNSEENKLI